MHTRLRQTGMNRDRKGLFILFVQGDAVNIRHFDDVRKLFEIERYLVGNNSVHIVCHHAAIGIIEHGIVRVRACKREACFVRVNNILKRFFRLVGRLSLGDLPLVVLHIARFDRERHRGVRVVQVKHKAVFRLLIEFDGLPEKRRNGDFYPITGTESVGVLHRAGAAIDPALHFLCYGKRITKSACTANTGVFFSAIFADIPTIDAPFDKSLRNRVVFRKGEGRFFALYPISGSHE